MEVEAAAQHVLGTEFQVNVNVSGCSAVSTLTLSDHGHLLSTVSNVALSSAQFTIHEQDLEALYATDGIAASLDLVAKATCSDGLSATSNGVGLSFMPADQVFPGVFFGTQLLHRPRWQRAGRVHQAGRSCTWTPAATSSSRPAPTSPISAPNQGYLIRGTADELYWVEARNDLLAPGPESSRCSRRTATAPSRSICLRTAARGLRLESPQGWWARAEAHVLGRSRRWHHLRTTSSSTRLDRWHSRRSANSGLVVPEESRSPTPPAPAWSLLASRSGASRLGSR